MSFYQFSQALQQKGLTQYAIAIAKKAMTLAMGERDPNFLVDLSEHLDDLGRAQDAARGRRNAQCGFINQRDRYGQTLYTWDLQRAVQSAGRAKGLREREPQLLAAVQKDPNSFQARVRLATFYEQTNQVQKASEAFEAALSLRPQDSMTRQRYAQMLERRGKAKEAAAPIPHTPQGESERARLQLLSGDADFSFAQVKLMNSLRSRKR